MHVKAIYILDGMGLAQERKKQKATLNTFRNYLIACVQHFIIIHFVLGF